jgi:hypothetical protein
MNAGRELDALIAEKVMGLTPHPAKEGEAPGYAIDKVPNYSTEWDAAWQVVESIERRGWWVELWYGNGKYGPKKRAGCVIGAYGDDDTRFEEMDDTMPLAICAAALAFVEGAKSL